MEQREILCLHAKLEPSWRSDLERVLCVVELQLEYKDATSSERSAHCKLLKYDVELRRPLSTVSLGFYFVATERSRHKTRNLLEFHASIWSKKKK